VNLKLKQIIIIATLLIITMLITGCGPSELDNKKSAIMGKILSQNQVPYVAIASNGDKAEIIYEVSDGDDYDAQVVSDWGNIFATASLFNYTQITIVNTVNYQPYAKLTTSSEVVNALGNGYISEEEFWNQIEIEAVE
jgi:hypothetical protein